MIKYSKMRIDFRDGTYKEFNYVTHIDTKDFVLSLYTIENEYVAEKEHLGSWPLDTVKEWVRKNR